MTRLSVFHIHQVYTIIAFFIIVHLQICPARPGNHHGSMNIKNTHYSWWRNRISDGYDGVDTNAVMPGVFHSAKKDNSNESFLVGWRTPGPRNLIPLSMRRVTARSLSSSPENNRTRINGIGNEWKHSFFKFINRNEIKDRAALWWSNMHKMDTNVWAYIMPRLLHNTKSVESFVPLLADRFTQYISPVNIALLFTTSTSLGTQILRRAIMGSAALGGLTLLHDSYRFRHTLKKAIPRWDSYAVISGASSSSLGKALSKELLCGGYNLVLVDRNETQLQNLKNDLERLIAHEPIEETGIPCDRSRNMMVEQPCTPIEQSCSPIIKQRDIRLFCRDLTNPFTPFEVLRDLKRFNLLDKVDVLVCNTFKTAFGELQDIDYNTLNEVIDVNIVSTVHLTRALLPRMIRRQKHIKNGARVVLIGSATSFVPAPSLSVYSASKAFLQSFAKSIRRELLPHGVAVSLAIPPVCNDLAAMHQADNCLNDTNWEKIQCAAAKIVQGMSVGTDTIITGNLNKFFVHVISQIIPAQIIGTFFQPKIGCSKLDIRRIMPTFVPFQEHETENVRRKAALITLVQEYFPTITIDTNSLWNGVKKSQKKLIDLVYYPFTNTSLDMSPPYDTKMDVEDLEKQEHQLEQSLLSYHSNQSHLLSLSDSFNVPAVQ